MKSKAALLALLVLATVVLCGGQIVQQIVGSAAPAASGVTLYYGFGCNGTTTNTCTVGGTGGSANGFYTGMTITTGPDASGYTVNACGVNYFTTTGNWSCAVYDNNATGSNPISSCTASSAALSGSGWVENTGFSGCTLAASTNYKIIFQTSGAPTYFYNSTGTNYYAAESYGSFVSSVSWSSQSQSRSLYIRVTSK